jgi:hypothetical protein
MTPTVASAAAISNPPLVPMDRFTRPDGRPQRVMPLMRRIEVVHLSTSQQLCDFTRIVPAMPVFEDAFAAFARNTLIQTERGHVSVEDIWPGDRVRTVEHGFQTLLWRGMTLLVPQANGQDPTMGRLTRIASDALGIARPMSDLLLGPRARLAHAAPGVKQLTGQDRAFVPARDFTDGINVMELTPPAPVQVYHLGFAGHERLLAGGVEVESFHPGPAHALGLRGELLALYLSCFPHMADLEAFGPMALPRLRMADLDLISAA